VLSDSTYQNFHSGQKRRFICLVTKALKIFILTSIFFINCFPQTSNSVVSDSVTATTSSTTTIVLGVSGAVAVTALLFHYDQDIYNEIHGWREQNAVVRTISPAITNMGDGSFSMGLFGGFAGYGLIFNNKKAVEVGKIGIESFLLTGISVQLLKHLCGRERPSDATQPGGFWHGPFAFFDKQKRGTRGLASYDAFPSGHTATAFAAATTISDFYTEPWVSYTCYSLASFVAVSRVMERTHWLSDCFVGAIIGHYGTRLVERLNYGSSGVTLLPQADEHQYGLLLCIKF
jgi:membrane-associated phospholipid phosphatase